MEVVALEGDVDGLARTLSKRHRQSTMRKTKPKHTEPSHLHPKCSKCSALVGKDGKNLNQPKITVTCAALRRMQTNKAYNPADFEILLLAPTAEHPFYLLPETYMHIGESGELAAQRTLNDTASLVGMRAHCVAFNGQTGRRPHHTVTSLFVLSCASHERPSTGKFYNLFHVVSNKGAFPLGHGHRELVYEAAGYVRLRCKQETIDPLFTASSRSLVSGVKNALFGQRFPTHATEPPLITFHNPHFQAEPLRALARGRRNSSGSAMLMRPRDKVVSSTPGPDATNTEHGLASSSSTSSIMPPPAALAAAAAVGAGVGVGVGAGSAAAAATLRPSSSSSSLPPATPNAAGSAVAAAAGGDGEPPTPSSAGSGGKGAFFRSPSTRQQHLSALRDDDEDDEDDVVLALRGLNNKSSPRRPSQQSDDHTAEEHDDDDDHFGAHHRIPDGAFNPLADDLDADFSNPLAEV